MNGEPRWPIWTEHARRFDPAGEVLELAGGTGWWTQRLAERADSLTVVDASPETLEINRARVNRPDVDYIVADLFDWHPTRRYDVVFFSFWISHVPRPRFASFCELVSSCLLPSGRVFLIDNRLDPHLAPRRPLRVRGGTPMSSGVASTMDPSIGS